MTNIAFVGGSRLLRGGLRMVLEQAGAEIVAEYRCSDDAVRRTPCAKKPLVYLLKHSPGIRSIRHEIRTLRKADPEARIAVLAERLAPDELIDVFASGGDGLMLEEIGASALHESLKLIALGEKVFPSQLATLLSGRRAGRAQARPAGPLTEREFEIVQRLAAGLSNKEIANELDLAVATVKVHVKSLLKKLGLSNRTQAAIWALNAGLVEPPSVTISIDETPCDPPGDAGTDSTRTERGPRTPPLTVVGLATGSG
jgi:two-component system, NarL family, nitrate/nitrite response regulator NarL